MLKFLTLYSLFIASLCAMEINLLPQSSIYLDYNESSITTIESKTFSPTSLMHINYGFNKELTIWLSFDIENKSDKNKNFVIEVNNPLLEEVIFYDENHTQTSRGMLHVEPSQHHINPALHVELNAHSSKHYYLSIKNRTTALQFSLLQVEEKDFVHEDIIKQFSIILFIGLISAFLLYSLTLYFYTKDISYLYYVFYISTLLFQQLTYVGFLPLYMSKEFTQIDAQLVVPKVALMIIAAILFARSFLKTKEFLYLDRIYKAFIYVLLAQIILFSSPYLYLPQITILTGLLFIFFNLYAGIYVYKQGNTQARFFIVGWSVLIVGYFFSIIDALGMYSIMYYFPQLILLSTVFEALFLLLAFVDKINLLQEQKDRLDSKLFNELQLRNNIIKQEVATQTNSITLLYKELHHRVKNNLQIILSIIRMQADKVKDIQNREEFSKLENRINAIAKTHELLYQNELQEDVDMHEYIQSLLDDIKTSYSPHHIDILFTCRLNIALKEAVYIGLILNELISNAFKHSQCTTLRIIFRREKRSFYLHVEDNGIGYKIDSNAKGLGLKLVNTLVTSQLNGTINTKIDQGLAYDIRFNL